MRPCGRGDNPFDSLDNSKTSEDVDSDAESTWSTMGASRADAVPGNDVVVRTVVEDCGRGGRGGGTGRAVVGGGSSGSDA